MKRKSLALTAACSLLLTPAGYADDMQSMEQLRNTVINLLEGLVQKGVLTREQAQAMVADAQAKAEATAKAKSDQEAAEKDAVRVTYVPESVRQQIREEVQTGLRRDVTRDVVARAKTEQWAIPGALPDWITRLKISGDLRVRGQSDTYAEDNATNTYLDFLTVNNRGGIGKAGASALLNTTQDRLRERIRLRVGLNAQLSEGISANFRLATGNLADPVSTNQTLGQSGARYTVGVDQAYLRYDLGASSELPWMTVTAGRMPNPWVSSDLAWDPDLQFDGLASTWRLGFNGSGATRRNLFLTAGAFPLQEVELSTQDKWLYGAQLGLDWPWGRSARIRIAGAYYYFDNITGVRNSVDSSLSDFTAPQWMQKGNTLFDIRNDLDATTNLYALASEYHIAAATLALEIPVLSYKVLLTGEAVRNLGFDAQEIFVRTGTVVEERTDGYFVDLAFGTFNTGHRNEWRASIGYRYLERDALLDAIADSDFHLGGTDAKGYIVRGEWWFRDRASVGLRYYSANEIDGPPLGIDTLMLDLYGQF